MERSKLVDKNAYLKWYDLAREEVNDENLIPKRSKEEIFGLISRENWLLFCNNNEDKEIATQKADPNVFFDVLSKEGNLTGMGRLGLTFNNLGAYEKFKTIMRGVNKELKEKITKELLNLKYPWKMKVDRKIKQYNYAQTPEYEEEGVWDTKQINEEIIDTILEIAKKIREQGIENRERKRDETGNPKKFYTETPTINLMEADFKLNEEEFKDRISEIFKILSLCLNVKTDVEVNKIIRNKSKELAKKKEILSRLNEELVKDKKMVGVISQITEEKITEKEERKKSLEEEILRLEKEISE